MPFPPRNFSDPSCRPVERGPTSAAEEPIGPLELRAYQMCNTHAVAYRAYHGERMLKGQLEGGKSSFPLLQTTLRVYCNIGFLGSVIVVL
jgi:hypothetical protein